MGTGHTQELTIASLKRLKSSRNGNPAFLVEFTNGLTARTQTDSMVSYAIENSEYQGVPVAVSFTRSGRISDIEPAGAPAE